MSCTCGAAARHAGASRPRERVWVGNVAHATARNPDYRRVLRTGAHQQLVLMSIPPATDIGLEVHRGVDQFLRVERGRGVFEHGPHRDHLSTRRIGPDDAMFVPAGTWHNVRNTGASPLKLYTLYAPPQHPPRTRQRAKPAKDEQ